MYGGIFIVMFVKRMAVEYMHMIACQEGLNQVGGRESQFQL
jgi:hypothetical protein